MTPLALLLLEDDPLDAELALAKLADEGLVCAATVVDDEAGFVAALKAGAPDVILSDYSLPGFSGGEALRLARELRPETPFIFVSGALGEELAIDCVKRGATDYVLKHRLQRLAPAVRRALREAEDAAERRRAEERFKLLVEGVHDHAIFWVDAAGVVTTWNTGGERLLGYPAAAAVGRPMWELMVGDEAPARAARLAEALARDGTGADEGLYAAGDGRLLWASVAVTAMKDARGATIGYGVVLRDRSEAKRAEEALKGAKQAAEDASRAKSEFLANMSHEIRTPLNAILGFAELLGEDEVTEDDRREWARTVHANGRQLARLVDDILDLSKVEAGKLPVESLPFAADALLAEVRALFELQAQRKGLDLTVTADGLPPGRLVSDPTRLRQILVNLVGNALKFTETGGIFVRVTVAPLADGEDGRAVLVATVADTGSGLTEEQAARLFQRFAQADQTVGRRFGGTGLGLTLSRHLARLLGGDLRLARTEPGKGSVFVLTVPVGTAAAAAGEPAAEPAAGERLDGVRVLLVDDTSDNRLLIGKLLDVAGAEVDTAVDGGEGLEKALAGEHDVVLMDVQLPDMDGFDATRRLRELGYGKPIVALTAHAMAGYRERCLAAGFDDHVPKPVDRRALTATVARLHARSGRRLARRVEGGDARWNP